MIIETRLPNPICSPNSRKHWAQKSKAKKQDRTHAFYDALGAGCREGMKFKVYKLHFIWPDRRRRDRDNAVASCKAILDGISDAIGQDDSEWEFDGVRFLEPDKNNPRLIVLFDE